MQSAQAVKNGACLVELWRVIFEIIYVWKTCSHVLNRILCNFYEIESEQASYEAQNDAQISDTVVNNRDVVSDLGVYRFHIFYLLCQSDFIMIMCKQID